MASVDLGEFEMLVKVITILLAVMFIYYLIRKYDWRNPDAKFVSEM